MRLPFSGKKNSSDQWRSRRDVAAQRQAEQPSVSTFRQGRTLTGSRSSEVASSNEYNADFLSPRAHVHHLTKHRRRLGWRFVGVAIIVAGLIVFLSQFIATTAISSDQDVAISDAKLSSYNARAQSYLNDHLLERFQSMTNIDNFTKYMQQEHPEVASTRISLTGDIGKAQVAIKLRKPVARWVVNGQTEYVDDEGIVFGYSPFVEPGVTIVDNNHYPSNTSANLVASHRFLTFVGQVVGDGAKQGYVINKAELPELMTRALEVRVKGVSYTFKLSVDRPAGQQTEDMARVIRYMKQKGITPKYVDLRIKGEAYYK